MARVMAVKVTETPEGRLYSVYIRENARRRVGKTFLAKPGEKAAVRDQIAAYCAQVEGKTPA